METLLSKSPEDLFTEAENLFRTKQLDEANDIYLSLAQNVNYRPFCYYRLAAISNMVDDPRTARDLYYHAFLIKPDLFQAICDSSHPNHNYVYAGKKEEALLENCPLCGSSGKPRWCYPVIELAAAYVQKYNPVRVWMHCDKCHHMYAENFPEVSPEDDSADIKIIKADKKPTWAATPSLFPHYSKIITTLMRFAKGPEFLEVGLGGCECSLVARELGLNVFGIDISEQLAMDARNLYGLNVEKHDLVEFNPNKKWDIIVMGDVIEHVSDPLRAIEKAYELLNDNGVLWISTPNFESAFSMISSHGDPMRRVANHKNYFSRTSLYYLLQKFHFTPVDYQISAHYNGSMEVIAVKDGLNS